MNNTLTKVLWFAAGATVGVAATNHFFKTKYERLYQEDVESVKRAFSGPQQAEPVADSTEPEPEPANDSEPTAQEVINYAAIISAQGYDTEAVAPVESTRKEVKGVARPYVISPTEFDTEDDYEVVTLNYFADGVLADEAGNVIEDVEGMVGRESLTHYGEYEDDAVHVRNDALKCDFEILRDLSNYSEVYHNGPRPDED